MIPIMIAPPMFYFNYFIMIKIGLLPVFLEGIIGKFRARIKTIGTVGIEQVAETMVREGCTISKGDIIAVHEKEAEVVGNFLKQGYNVKLPLANFKPGIKGVFNSITDGFDRSRHELRVNVTPGIRTLHVLDNVPVEKVETKDNQPHLTSFYDHNSKGETNLTPGGAVTVNGYRLDFNAEDPDQGIFLVNGVATHKVTVIVKSSPKELIFTLPADLPKGDYTLEIRRKFGETGSLKSDSIPDLIVE